MSKTAIETLLDSILYPKLEKSIVDLGLVEEVKLDGKNLTVTLGIQNESAFEEVEQAIRKKLGDDYKLSIRPKASKESITYGSTKAPNNRAPYARYVLAVTSGKGGVGKTTVSVNLSIALKQLGFSDEKLRWTDNDKIATAENFGIKSISVGMTTPSHDTPLVWRSSVAISALIQFLEDVDWGELDFLVIDMPPGTGDVQLTMAQELPLAGGVLVTTPQNVATDDVSRAIMMFKETGVKIGGLVENMSYFVAPDTGTRYDIFGKKGGQELAVRYQIPFLGEIPLDMEVRSASDEGRPPVAMGNDTQKSYYKTIAQELLKSLEIPQKS